MVSVWVYCVEFVLVGGVGICMLVGVMFIGGFVGSLLLFFMLVIVFDVIVLWLLLMVMLVIVFGMCVLNWLYVWFVIGCWLLIVV